MLPGRSKHTMRPNGSDVTVDVADELAVLMRVLDNDEAADEVTVVDADIDCVVDTLEDAVAVADTVAVVVPEVDTEDECVLRAVLLAVLDAVLVCVSDLVDECVVEPVAVTVELAVTVAVALTDVVALDDAVVDTVTEMVEVPDNVSVDVTVDDGELWSHDANPPSPNVDVILLISPTALSQLLVACKRPVNEHENVGVKVIECWYAALLRSAVALRHCDSLFST